MSIENYLNIVMNTIQKKANDVFRFDLLLEAVGEGIYGVDANGNTTFVNTKALELLRATTKDVYGKNMHNLLHHTKEDGSSYAHEDCPIYAAFKDGKIHYVERELFWRLDGTSFPVEYTSTPIKDNNELIGAIIVFRDITERIKAENNLNKALIEISTLKDELEQERDYLRSEVKRSNNIGEIIGESEPIQGLMQKISAVASTPAPVLIMGESGVGKEMVANAIHESSDRKDKTLVSVNCASIPYDLFESEFFGHVKGAFTGASSDRLGRFSLADGGTLFLDEITEMPLSLQSKLLRVLQDSTITRVGDDKPIKIDVRIIAASNRDLRHEIANNKFREDLYYRISVFPIEIPPLRQRSSDIKSLADYFLSKASTKFGRKTLPLTKDDYKLLEGYNWPGNVRELQNIIERAVISSIGKKVFIDKNTLEKNNFLPNNTISEKKYSSEIDSLEQLDEIRKNIITTALEKTNWRISGPHGAAKLLKLKPSTLTYQMKCLGIKNTI